MCWREVSSIEAGPVHSPETFYATKEMNEIIQTYNSEFGEIELNINSQGYGFETSQTQIGNVKELVALYEDGEIIIREFKLPNPIYKGMFLYDSIGWSIILKAKQDNKWQIPIRCALINEVKGYSDTGENLDSINFESNNKYQMNIGTEDAESMMWRAKHEDYMPKRFYKKLKNWKEDFADKTFLKYLENGLEVRFPILINNEIVKFHFLVAESEMSDKNDVRTWMAVEQRIKYIEELIEKEKKAA